MGIETFKRHFHEDNPGNGNSNGQSSGRSSRASNGSGSSSAVGPSSRTDSPAGKYGGARMNGASGQMTIAFLKCDKLPEEAVQKHGTYEEVLHNLLEPMLPKRRRRHSSHAKNQDGKPDSSSDEQEEKVVVHDTERHRDEVPDSQGGHKVSEEDENEEDEEFELRLETKSYDVVNKREYPTERELEETDAIVISGSFEVDADADSRESLRLAGFLIEVYDRYPHIRIVGICFGLQIICRAFGPSQIIKNPKGWEVGSTPCDLTPLGKRIIYGDESDSPDHVMMQQIHSSIVEKVPDDFELLCSSELTPVQGVAHLYEDGNVPDFKHSDQCCASSDPWRRVHIIAFQGHPEWHEDILLPLIDEHLAEGAFSEEYARGARERARQKHDGEILGRAILKVLGVA